jgi:hypothetical protein
MVEAKPRIDAIHSSGVNLKKGVRENLRTFSAGDDPCSRSTIVPELKKDAK